MSKLKFIASFSGGKDSTLALCRAIEEGHEPLALLTSYNKQEGKSWFNCIPQNLLQCVARQMNIPLWLLETGGDNYTTNYNKMLVEAKMKGAQAVVFGDIDLEVHRKWCTERCEAAGLVALFPLWNEGRKKLVYEFIDRGFVTYINVVDSSRLSPSFLGKQITKELVKAIEEAGADACGENGEYHSFVCDGPLFASRIPFKWGTEFRRDKNAYLPPILDE